MRVVRAAVTYIAIGVLPALAKPAEYDEDESGPPDTLEFDDEPPELHEDDEDHEIGLTPEALRKAHASFDANKDGKVTLDELKVLGAGARKFLAKADAEDEVKSLDRDKNGKVSLAEFNKDLKARTKNKALKAREEAKFKAADANGDGELDKEEFHHYLAPGLNDKVLDADVAGTMTHRDKNGDGKLTEAEFYEGADKDEIDEQVEDAEHADHDRLLFKRFDSNKDGFLDLQELKTLRTREHHVEDNMAQLISVADKDGDGHLTIEEMEKSGGALLSDPDIEEHLSILIKAHEKRGEL